MGRQSTVEGFAGIANSLSISGDEVERLFDVHEGTLQYVGDLEAFGTTKAAKVAAIATLLAAARQAGKFDEGATTDAVIRAEVDRHGLLDVGNYTKHTALIKPYFNVNGSGRSATYKVKYEGKTRAKELARVALGK